VWCSVVVMKIISWNIRGLGGFEKRREVSQLMREKKPFIVCFQETKLTVFDDVFHKIKLRDELCNFSFLFYFLRLDCSYIIFVCK